MDSNPTSPRKLGTRNVWQKLAMSLAMLAVIKVAAVVGALFAIIVAGFSIVAFDAPDSGDRILPYVILAGAWTPAVASVAVLMRTNRLLAEGRTALAYALLLLPPVYAGSLLFWIRYG